MFTLTGFADEIAPELDKQIEVMNKLGISHIEFRGVDGKNVLDLTDEAIEDIKKTLDDNGFKISAIGSPIGKVKITDDFSQHLERFKRALYLADFFGADYIRLFSYYIPEGEKPEKYRDEVMERMKKKTELAEEAGIILLHENERGIYGATGPRCLDIMRTIDSPYLRAIHDPANYIAVGEEPYPYAFELLLDYIDYLHIKDAIPKDGKEEVKPAGQGQGEIEKMLKVLKDRGFNGFLSLEPHLAIAGRMKGFSGPEAFEVATNALKKILDNIGAEY